MFIFWNSIYNFQVFNILHEWIDLSLVVISFIVSNPDSSKQFENFYLHWKDSGGLSEYQIWQLILTGGLNSCWVGMKRSTFHNDE